MVEAAQSNNNYDDPVYAKFKNVLKGAEMGKVVTRFPPEPSGYLHIGHVKAAMLNYHYAKMYNGKMILRFDDTNPMNEKEEFVQNIIRDLKTLEITPDQITFTSDYFKQTEDFMRQLIEQGLAYADNTPSEQMKEERDKGVESVYRTATVQENLDRFQFMLDTRKREEEEKKKGGKAGGKKPPSEEEKKRDENNDEGEMKQVKSVQAAKEEKKKAKETAVAKVQSDWCIRAKMNMQDKVKCLRDPVFYRVKRDTHHKTGEAFCAYPTYDFACPIVDSLEGITHCLRTIEYHDRNALYAWVQEKLGLRKVVIYDYSRLNLVSTVLSKRSLKWFVESGHAEGWYDPRFPTVQGIMRRGLTVEALKLFMLEQGPSKNTNLMEWDKLWALNAEIIDRKAPRYNAVEKTTAVRMVLENVGDEVDTKSVPLHPKNEAIGSKSIIMGNQCWIEKDDADRIEEGEKIALRNYGKVLITKKAVDGESTTIYGTLDREDQNYKKVKIVTWINANDDFTVDLNLVEFDHLITKQKVEENDDVKDIVNKNSKAQYSTIGEGIMRHLKKGDMIQIERRGYFFVDQAAVGSQKLTLHYIPDGKMNPMSHLKSKFEKAEQAKGKGKGKKNEEEAKEQVEGQQPEGEKKGPSKKELAKAARKEKAKQSKEAKKTETDQKAEATE